jgi:3-hydroxyacyl-CoA dehydrogenase/enoyl-CoA hydratase/3-hydroxybutyryl-CoA epimerase
MLNDKSKEECFDMLTNQYLFTENGDLWQTGCGCHKRSSTWGGCEIALACHYRIMSSHPKKLYRIGRMFRWLFPGAGGTQRF